MHGIQKSVSSWLLWTAKFTVKLIRAFQIFRRIRFRCCFIGATQPRPSYHWASWVMHIHASSDTATGSNRLKAFNAFIRMINFEAGKIVCGERANNYRWEQKSRRVLLLTLAPPSHLTVNIRHFDRNCAWVKKRRPVNNEGCSTIGGRGWSGHGTCCDLMHWGGGSDRVVRSYCWWPLFLWITLSTYNALRNCFVRSNCS